jgi:hypothetical protein
VSFPSEKLSVTTTAYALGDPQKMSAANAALNKKRPIGLLNIISLVQSGANIAYSSALVQLIRKGAVAFP